MLKKVFGIASTVSLIIILNISFYNLPPLGKFLDPFNGYCALINSDMLPSTTLQFSELIENVEVIYDSLRVPHVFAKNEHDLFFIQGYLTAFDRLWQMEFQTHAAAGRLSEIFGSKALGYDRFQRRIGMVYGAENTLNEVKRDSITYANLIAYTNGVNLYINTIDRNKYPLEYKILNYAPEEWTPLKTSLLLKKMAWTLTGRSTDLAYTKMLNDLGENILDELFPVFPPTFEPIIPRGTQFNFKNEVNPPSEKYKPTADIQFDSELFPEKNMGSNNWAIHGSRTNNGHPILSNDPHLGLNLPSIWYMIHLNCPTINTMGVTIPGAPGIIVGFNENISWGVTNGNDDVMDWYDITFKDSNRDEYLYDNNWLPVVKKIEQIYIRDETPYIDTVSYTHHGPIVWDYNMQTPPIGSTNSKNNMTQTSSNRSLKWLAHEPSNELKSFFLINKSTNYDEFIHALRDYKCPGQNFIFADKKGDIGIIHSGSQPTKWFKQGIYIQNGSSPDYEWGKPISHDYKPQIKNPRAGYLSSANQHPTDETYPYFLSGDFWMSYRAIEINRNLDTLYKATIHDSKNIQLNNKSRLAQNILPQLIKILSDDTLHYNDSLLINKLKNWSFEYSKSSVEATVFDVWIKEIEKLTWYDNLGKEDSLYLWPHINIIDDLIINNPKSKWFDNKSTTDIEYLDDIANSAFRNTINYLTEKFGYVNDSWEWGNYRGTNINHIANIPGLGIYNIQTDGAPEIINATGKTFGPSWRYNIELSEKINAIGIYPGGQSGYPGSYYYDNFIEDWSNGIYYNLEFSNASNDINGKRFTCTAQ